jgi:signal peptidase II
VVAEWLLPAGLVLLFDQMCKRLVLIRLAEGQWISAGAGVRIRRVSNTRAGQRFGRHWWAFPLIWLFAVAGTVYLLHGGTTVPGPACRIALGTALGGATGNLVDCLRYGAIIDFIDARVWPVFNIADAAIVVGVGGALLTLR